MRYIFTIQVHTKKKAMAKTTNADNKRAPTLFQQNQRIRLKTPITATQIVGKSLNLFF
jgi:hypothetical protein